MQRLRLGLWSVRELLFWEAGAQDVPADLSQEKLDEIVAMLRFQVRKATSEDLPLFKRYYVQSGGLMRWGRIRALRRRWANGDDCYLALDRRGEIVAQLWIAYERCLIEGRWRRVGRDEIYYYGVDTRPDQLGSMGYVACAAAAVPEFVQRGRLRAVAWVDPPLFDKFRQLSAWMGLANPRPVRLERWTRVCGLRFCRRLELDENWTYQQHQSAAR
jgi:hypothetical protein